MTVKSERKNDAKQAILISIAAHLCVIGLVISLSSGGLISPAQFKGMNLVWVSLGAGNDTDDAQKVKTMAVKSLPVSKPAAENTTPSLPAVPETQKAIQSAVTAAKSTGENTGTKLVSSSLGVSSRGSQEPSVNIQGTGAGKSSDMSSINSSVAFPLYKENTLPAYPEIARIRGYEGVVLVSAEILPSGQVGEIKIRRSSGYAILDQSAVQAVKPWKFEPARRSGNPFTAWVELPIKFILHKNSQS